jgi:hypothetical protein
MEEISDTPNSDCLWHGGGQQPEHGVQAISELITDFVPSLGFNPVESQFPHFNFLTNYFNYSITMKTNNM